MKTQIIFTRTFTRNSTEVQRDALVLALRKCGFVASRESVTLRTDASIASIALVNGCSLIVR